MLADGSISAAASADASIIQVLVRLLVQMIKSAQPISLISVQNTSEFNASKVHQNKPHAMHSGRVRNSPWMPYKTNLGSTL